MDGGGAGIHATRDDPCLSGSDFAELNVLKVEQRHDLVSHENSICIRVDAESGRYRM
jgi:hypothetical protein